MDKQATLRLRGEATGMEGFSGAQANVVTLSSAIDLGTKALDLYNAAWDRSFQFVGQFVETSSRFEQYTVQFTSLMDSAEMAEDRMRSLFDFAVRTPYELSGVVQAAKTMEAYGIYSERALRAAGDAASALGIELEEGVLAVAAARTGEMERLKRFGIVTADLAAEMGHEVSRSTQADLEEIGDAVISLFEKKFGGGMDALAETMEGRISNLQDSWERFKLIVGDAGPFQAVNSVLTETLAVVDELFASGKGQQLGQTVGETIGDYMMLAVVELGRSADALVSIAGTVGKPAGGAVGGAQAGYQSFAGLPLWQRALVGLGGGPALASVGVAGMLGVTAGGDQPERERGAIETMALEARRRYYLRSRGAWQQAGPGELPYGPLGGLGPIGETEIGMAGEAERRRQYLSEVDSAAAERARFAGMAAEMGGVAGPPGFRTEDLEDRDAFEKIMGFSEEELSDAEAKMAEHHGTMGEQALTAWSEHVLGSNEAQAAWSAFYSGTLSLGKKWGAGQKLVARDVANVALEGIRGATSAFLEGKAQEAGAMALMAGANALYNAFTNPAAAATQLLAAAKYAAISTAFGLAAGAVTTVGTGGEGAAAAGAGLGGSTEVEPAGSRSIMSRTTGTTVQNLTINVTIVHNGTTVYGDLDRFVDELVDQLHDRAEVGDI